MNEPAPGKYTLAGKFLKLFADVKPGEGPTALLLAINIFLLLMAYYVLKPVREGLILGEGSAELKTYMSAFQVVLLAFVVPLYGRLVSQLSRRKLINTVTAFFVGCLFLFYGLGKAGVHLGIVFFLWIGIFNLMIVAQFWSFANDIYTKDQGERLFAVVGFGASLGAVMGSRLVGMFIHKFGIFELMLVGAGLLIAQVAITNWIDHRERAATEARKAAAAPKAKAAVHQNAFQMVFKTRYLFLMAIMLLIANNVNTTGEYILGHIVKDAAVEHVGAAGPDAVKNEIAGFYSNYFTYVNIIGLVMQMFVVSRVVKYFGVRVAISALPTIAMAAYGIITFVPFLHAVLAAKVAENSTDYSLNNTARNMLFLPCTPEQKYSAKQAIDSFFVRMGDVTSAAIVFVCTTMFNLHPRGFALINLVMVVAWLLMARRIGKEYNELSKSGHAPEMAR